MTSPYMDIIFGKNMLFCASQPANARKRAAETMLDNRVLRK